MEENVNLKLVLTLIRRKIIPIIIISVLSAAIMFFASKYLITKQYSSSISLYVSNNIITSSERIQPADLSASTLLAQDCKELFKEQSFLSSLSAKVDGRISPAALSSAIAVTALENTRIVKIVVTTPDAQLSADICTNFPELADEVIKSIVGAAASAKAPPNTVTKPSARPSYPNVYKNAAIGAVIGASLSIGFLFVAFIIDNTVKDEEDIRIHLDIPVLGEIPCLQDKSERGRKKNG